MLGFEDADQFVGRLEQARRQAASLSADSSERNQVSLGSFTEEVGWLRSRLSHFERLQRAAYGGRCEIQESSHFEWQSAFA